MWGQGAGPSRFHAYFTAPLWSAEKRSSWAAAAADDLQLLHWATKVLCILSTAEIMGSLLYCSSVYFHTCPISFSIFFFSFKKWVGVFRVFYYLKGRWRFEVANVVHLEASPNQACNYRCEVETAGELLWVSSLSPNKTKKRHLFQLESISPLPAECKLPFHYYVKPYGNSS